MSLSTAIETAWAPVWAHANITNYTDKIYSRDFSDFSESELRTLFKNGKVNFITWQVKRAQVFGVTSTINYSYTVLVRYYRTKGPSKEEWAEVRDFFEDLFSTVRSQLSSTWSGTVDYWATQEGEPEIITDQISNTQVWRGSFVYTAVKAVSA